MALNSVYYLLKPAIPRFVQIAMRRKLVQCQREKNKSIWPIDEEANKKPDNWPGWPDGKKFALILTHDVDTAIGQSNCKKLSNLETKSGFKSSFNFVPERYKLSHEIMDYLRSQHEIGVHGLKHDGKLYQSREIFKDRANKINKYLKQWKSDGFRSPSMLHNLEWIHDLDILYDASTFDTDPFEPQPEGVKTIFPFLVKDENTKKSYVELPYTLAQDFTLFILMQEKNINLWKRKLDWIVEKGGMALINAHPDYMNFKDEKPKLEQYPARYYQEFLEYVSEEYKDQYWNVLPKDIAEFWNKMHLGLPQNRLENIFKMAIINKSTLKNKVLANIPP